MKKSLKTDEVLDKIKEAVLKEELALPIYTTHISAAMFWSGLSLEKQKKITNLLKILKRESQGHIKALEQAKKLYAKSLKK